MPKCEFLENFVEFSCKKYDLMWDSVLSQAYCLRLNISIKKNNIQREFEKIIIQNWPRTCKTKLRQTRDTFSDNDNILCIEYKNLTR